MTEPSERRPLTVAELVAVLTAAMERNPAVGGLLVLTTSEAGYVHEHVSGIDVIDDEYLTLGEP